MPRILKIITPLLLLVLVVLFFTFRPSKDDQDAALKEKGLQVREIDDPEGDIQTEVVVDPSAIPVSMKERLTAPSMSLLPNKTGYPEMQGEFPLSKPELAELKKFSESFLREWETYQPADRSYQRRLEPMSSPRALPDIAARLDSVDKAGACPGSSCTEGSRWVDQNFEQSSFLLDVDRQYAYLVAYGAVLYGERGRQEDSASRSYGLILSKKGDGWQVERVAAESLR